VGEGGLLPDNASATGEPAGLAERVRFAPESGDLGVIRDLPGSAVSFGRMPATAAVLPPRDRTRKTGSPQVR
jgi:hypothetical protein